MPHGSTKKYPRTSSIVQIIFSFWSFEISKDILRNQKIIGLDTLSDFVSTTLLQVAKNTVIIFQVGSNVVKTIGSLKRLK